MKTLSTVSMILGASVAIAVFSPPQAAHAGTFNDIKPAVLKVEGKRYWRKNAGQLFLGSVCQKMTPIAGKNYCQRVQTAPAGMFKVHVSQPYELTSKERTSFESEGEFDYGVVEAKGNPKGKGEFDAKYAAFKMSIDLGNHRKGSLGYELQHHPKHLATLKDLGNAGRIIAENWILVKGTERQLSCFANASEGDLFAGVIKFKDKLSSCGEVTVKIPNGAILAYSIAKVTEWDKQARTQPVDCPDGFKRDVRKSSLTPMDQCVKTTFEKGGTKCALGPLDKASNWFVSPKKKRDVCESKKDKGNKEVKCADGGKFEYVVQDGRDICQKPTEVTRDPTCPAGWDYDKKSTGNDGKDQCHLEAPGQMKLDSNDGF